MSQEGMSVQGGMSFRPVCFFCLFLLSPASFLCPSQVLCCGVSVWQAGAAFEDRHDGNVSKHVVNQQNTMFAIAGGLLSLWHHATILSHKSI